MLVPQSIRDEIIAHCQALTPNQACGLVLFDSDGVARWVEKAINYGAWPYGFQIAPQSHFSAFSRARDEGWSIGGVYHCHTVSEAIPTGRDIKRPVPPGMLYLIVSLLFPDKPDIRGFTLTNGIPCLIDLDTGRSL
jgi:[CysO sulfur-carrier protein]-S-L-cysteine hydrolase